MRDFDFIEWQSTTLLNGVWCVQYILRLLSVRKSVAWNAAIHLANKEISSLLWNIYERFPAICRCAKPNASSPHCFLIHCESLWQFVII